MNIKYKLSALVFGLCFSAASLANDSMPFKVGVVGGYDFGTSYASSFQSNVLTQNTTGTYEAGATVRFLKEKSFGFIANVFYEGSRNFTSETTSSGATLNYASPQPQISGILPEIDVLYCFGVPYIFAGGNYMIPSISNFSTTISASGSFGYEAGAGVMLGNHIIVDALYRVVNISLTQATINWDYFRESSFVARAGFVF